MRRVLMLATLGLVVGTIVGPPAIAAAEKAIQDVFITNTSANPVPVNGTVSVDNLPASQEVTGTVNVGNLPATQTVTGTVNVANAVDHAPAEPIAALGALAGDLLSQQLIQVPAGRTAVIETVSARFTSDPSGVVPRVEITVHNPNGDHLLTHFLALDQESTATSPSNPDRRRTSFIGTEAIRLYAPAGSVVRAFFRPDAIDLDQRDDIDGFVSVTGYLVDTHDAGA